MMLLRVIGTLHNKLLTGGFLDGSINVRVIEFLNVDYEEQWQRPKTWWIEVEAFYRGES